MSEEQKPQFTIEDLLQSLKTKGDNAQDLYNLGLLYAEDGQQEKAIDFYFLAIQHNPNDARAHNSLGVAYTNTGKLKKAKASFKKAMKIDPACVSATMNLASIYKKSRKLDRVRRCYASAVRQSPEDLNILLQLAEVSFDVGYRNDAVEAYERILALDPNHVPALVNCAQVCFFEKRYEDALEFIHRAMENGGENLEDFAAEVEAFIADSTVHTMHIKRSIAREGPEDPDLVIVYCCPPALDDAAKNNLQILMQSNPGVPIHVVNNMAKDKKFGRHNADQAFFKWFEKTHCKGRRFALIESDMLCTISLREFYKSVWNADVAAKKVFRPGDHWMWWREIGRLPAEYEDSILGVAPLAGMLFSRRAIVKITPHVFEMDDVYCELRVAVAAEYEGLEVSETSWETIRARDHLDSELTEPNLYHMVKRVVKR